MIKIRRSKDRGYANNGWLETYHTFSFNTYLDTKFMNYRKLRVINDDIIHPGQGFGTHSHNDMEIVTYILSGSLEHKDSLGNGSIIKAGEVQRITAGTGILHSEFNPSATDPVHLLQIWIFPDQKALTPSYEQKFYSNDDKSGKFLLIASQDGRNNSVTINQDASIYASIIERDQKVAMNTKTDRFFWLHVATGKIKTGGLILNAGDSASIKKLSSIEIVGSERAELLLFDLA